MNTSIRFLQIAFIFLLGVSCSGQRTTAANDISTADTSQPAEQTWPDFCADSAYKYVSDQVGFGPRVPGSESHQRCRKYLTDCFETFGADTIIVQHDKVKTFDGTSLPLYNILARFNTSAPQRILIAAHYDSRPWADEDPLEENHSKAIDGANDGASGVGVILELARNLQKQMPQIGVDFLLTDVEDYGSHDDGGDDGQSSWALGSQYFARNSPYTPRQRPVFGILLDMVGGRDARFYREYFSDRTARWVNTKVWNAAKEESIDRFVDEPYGAVTDDHIFINRAGIPCIDIIECANAETGSFPPTWHTLNDNLSNIDRATLHDVGRTLMRVIYTEQPQ